MQQLEPRTDGVSNSLTTVQKDNLLAEPNGESEYETCYRIRKLTPRECFRLMGVRDKDIDKIQAYPYATLEEYRNAIQDMDEKQIKKLRREKGMISDSRQYKMAGNSIVENCLYLIFKNAFITKTKCKPIPKQMTIFDVL